MSARKSFLLRVPPELHAALEKWADDELRSVNGQIEFLLAQAVKAAGRTIRPRPDPGPGKVSSPPPTEES